MERAHQDYYQAMNAILTAIKEHLAAVEHPNTPSLTGRSGSLTFEEQLLKPLLSQHYNDIIKLGNESLEDTGYTLTGLDFPDDSTEAGKRTPGDFYITWDTPHGPRSEYINIKATNGNTADNVGGWSALDQGLYGGEHGRAVQKRSVLKKISTTTFSTLPCDYFLWCFHKDDDAAQMIGSGATYSMFGSRGGFVFNASQSFPLQFRADRATGFAFTEGESMAERKQKFVMDMILCPQVLYHQKAGYAAQSVIDALESRTPSSPGTRPPASSE